MENKVKKLKKLQILRSNMQLTYKDVADMLKISKTYYWQIENGKRRLTYEFAKKISKIFNLKPDDIFYEDF